MEALGALFNMTYPGLPSHPCPYGSDGTNQFWFNPLQVLWYTDDFLSTNIASCLDWQSTQSGSSISTVTGQTSAHPGVFQFASGTGNFNNAALYWANTIILGGGRILLGFVAQLSQTGAVGNNFEIQMGLMDTYQGNNNGDPGNGVYFQYDYAVNSGDWVCNNKKAGTAHAVNSTIAADNAWHNFIIDINAAATSVSFYIDGVLAGTNTSDIPTVALSPCFNISLNANATNSTANLDSFFLYQFLTTSR